MPQANGTAARDPARTAILLAVDGVPDALVERLQLALAADGFVATAASGTSAPVDACAVICLFSRLDKLTEEELERHEARNAYPLLGVGLPPWPGAWDGDLAEVAWVRSGRQRRHFVYWDGVSSLSPILHHLRALTGIGFGPQGTRNGATGHRGPRDAPSKQPSVNLELRPMIEITLRNGRILRVPTDLPEAELLRLVARLEG